MMFVVSLELSSERSESCGYSSGGGDVSAVSQLLAGGLSEDQRANAAVIITEGYRLRVPRQGIVVALAVASQESRFLNYANDGEGSDLGWEQIGIARSLALPHQAVGTDHGSLGVFQQQWPWWGSMEELMDPQAAARKFYEALLRVPGWADLPVTVAGQAVQRSAYPDAYADDVPLAESLLSDPRMARTAGVTAAAFQAAGDASCAAQEYDAGNVVFPLPAGSGYVDQANWGNSGGNWSHGHTGTDLSVGCGTPVLAATGGRVIVRTDQPWSGPWLVQVSTGVGPPDDLVRPHGVA